MIVYMYYTLKINWTSLSAVCLGSIERNHSMGLLLNGRTGLNDRTSYYTCASQCFPDYICGPCRRTVERRIDSLSKSKSELWIPDTYE